MAKNGEGKINITISLPRGFHQYKFKIDDNWTYSKKQSKYEDNGNINNFIDTTDYDNLNEEENNEGENDNEKEPTNEEKDDIEKSKEEEVDKIEKKEEKAEKNTNVKIKVKKKSKLDNAEMEIEEEIKQGNNNNKNLDKKNSSTHNIHFLNSQNEYSIYYPLRTEFSKKPSALPGLFKTY